MYISFLPSELCAPPISTENTVKSNWKATVWHFMSSKQSGSAPQRCVAGLQENNHSLCAFHFVNKVQPQDPEEVYDVDVATVWANDRLVLERRFGCDRCDRCWSQVMDCWTTGRQQREHWTGWVQFNSKPTKSTRSTLAEFLWEDAISKQYPGHSHPSHCLATWNAANIRFGSLAYTATLVRFKSNTLHWGQDCIRMSTGLAPVVMCQFYLSPPLATPVAFLNRFWFVSTVQEWTAAEVCVEIHPPYSRPNMEHNTSLDWKSSHLQEAGLVVDW